MTPLIGLLTITGVYLSSALIWVNWENEKSRLVGSICLTISFAIFLWLPWVAMIVEKVYLWNIAVVESIK